MKIRDLLNKKDSRYRVAVTVKPEDTVPTAIQKLIDHDRGSLPVCDENGNLLGIITERDIVRKCFAQGSAYNETRIGDIMTGQVAICIPEDDLDYAIDVMKQKRIRHLPIVDGQQVIGMISMRDVFGVQYEEAKREIRYASLMPRRGQAPRY